MSNMEIKGSAASRGLAFCTTREAAEALGVSLRTAQLWVDSGILEAWKTEGGHRRVSLVSVERLLREDSRPSAKAKPDNRLKILVVEDDRILLKLYRSRIEAWDLPVSVTTASNGYEALILIGREQPDLMISDLHMPGMNGFEMVRTLVASSFREGMEIVVVSALSSEEIEEKGGLPPGIHCFSKPIPFAELRQYAEQLIERRKAADAAHN